MFQHHGGECDHPKTAYARTRARGRSMACSIKKMHRHIHSIGWRQRSVNADDSMRKANESGEIGRGIMGAISEHGWKYIRDYYWKLDSAGFPIGERSLILPGDCFSDLYTVSPSHDPRYIGLCNGMHCFSFHVLTRIDQEEKCLPIIQY